ncbi:MAG: hypothetical protein K2O12_00600 [Muribaculaceae bacterium]|nr:hypothetical protein [Muribaculaceae bacterium]
MRRIAAIGMFDGLHVGHRLLLDFLKTQAEIRGLEPAVVTLSIIRWLLSHPSASLVC